MKALRWWRGHNDCINKIVSDQDCQLYVISRFNKNGSCRARWEIKAISGRGPKLRPWTRYVRDYVTQECERLWELEQKSPGHCY